MSSWVTIGIEFIKTLAGPGKGRSRPRTDNSTAEAWHPAPMSGLRARRALRLKIVPTSKNSKAWHPAPMSGPESQTSIKTKDNPNQQELGGLASGALRLKIVPTNKNSKAWHPAPKVSWSGPGTSRALRPKILPTNRNSSVVAKLCDSFSTIFGGLPTPNR